jgi:UDP-N-acetylglucosamine 2-epimerase (non-hydrolysing)
MAQKIFVVLGTRPEAIKLAPLIIELREKPSLDTDILVFRQHGKVTDEVLKIFGLAPTYRIGLAFGDRSLGKGVNIFVRLFNLMRAGFGMVRFIWLLVSRRPNLLIVQGDTSAGLLAALIAFHFRISIAHVEAGLRTHDKYHPFPEEMNRQLICRLADFNFAPTEAAKGNLLREGVPPERVWMTGNTAIDALLYVLKKQSGGVEAARMEKILEKEYSILMDDRKIVIVTAHRRENFGKGLENIFGAVKELARENPDILFVVPVHSNPSVRKKIGEILRSGENIILTTPVAYEPFIYLMSKAHFLLSDSGGIQEEVSILGKPLLVMREKTERAEGVLFGNAKLVGVDKDTIIEAASQLIRDYELRERMSKKHSQYGDGTASAKIAEAIEGKLGGN